MAGIIIALIGSASVIGAAVIGNRKLNQIHVLVNQRLTDALNEIKNLRVFIDEKTAADATEVPTVRTTPEQGAS